MYQINFVCSYHSGQNEDWGKYLSAGGTGGRIVAVKLVPRSIDHGNDPKKACEVRLIVRVLKPVFKSARNNLAKVIPKFYLCYYIKRLNTY